MAGTGGQGRGLRGAIADLRDTFGARYPKADEYLRRLEALKGGADSAVTLVSGGDPAALPAARRAVDELTALRREALLANPLLDFDRLLTVRRRGFVGLPQNWQGNSSIPGTGYDNELCYLDPRRPDDPPVTLYKPPGGRFVGDLDLHWDATRLLFSMPDERGRWQVNEIRLDGSGLRPVTSGDQPDVSSFDACYLPDGRIVFCSTACFQGVPCVGGGDAVSLLYLLDPATGKVRQLTFDQDHSWDPFVLPTGRVLYGRWEYSDIPHYFSRLVMSMNPDGTAQSEYYGSNSYWPNSLFYCRPVPGSPTEFVGVVSGHHGERRAGELVLFDTAKGRREAAGVVQRIPGRGKPVPATIEDQLVAASWPKFLHPWPLSEKYFLVACRPSENADWGIYLADVFDNLVLLHGEPDTAFLEPVPVLPRPAPPVIVDKVQPQRRDAVVYVEDVYAGGGLDGVPRGTVKRLRVFEDHYTYNQMGGHIHVGVDGPWDVKRILGTVPVAADGSAIFRVPANTPVTVQPLDAEGRAVQLMRSWLTAMPGETLSCIGCHERRNDAPTNKLTASSRRSPDDITPWHGPARGFSFRREVQPVLDRYCVPCHDGQHAAPDLRDDGKSVGWGGFVPSYLALHPFVRRPGPESDYHLLTPLEFHAGTSELVQRLRKGHHGVQLDAEAWDRLYTWIDLNVPCHGTWHEHRDIPANFAARRRELRLLYANVADDPEAIPDTPPVESAPVKPTEPQLDRRAAQAEGWPFDAAEAQRRQAAVGAHQVTVEAGGVSLALVRAPAGTFVMGDPQGEADELPAHAVQVAASFWVGRCEVTNEQFARFDPAHDSRYISETNKDQTRRGIPVNGPRQPVVRVSWSEARAFCRWLSARLGARVDLPTEVQWEYACRAGSDTPLWFGGVDTDFAPFGNLADASLAGLARGDSPKWAPRDGRFNDGALVTGDVGRYRPNAWGLCDMAGNAAEWTRSRYRPYPAQDDTGVGERVVRGGSWYDRPGRCRSAFRLGYPEWQRVYNVGFRVVVEGDLPEEKQ
ncbi:MAG: SUMF1/EgtB/PvdO family nonheme iron enzyme [Armatimonadetes bacterium]|nr:SUMF1/EgtB/PvdO family nonheme iron enzyme [Armatimonadota bacterium]